LDDKYRQAMIDRIHAPKKRNLGEKKPRARNQTKRRLTNKRVNRTKRGDK
jgi:hypothetical protein